MSHIDVGEPYAPWDPGVQNERTALAWTRTALALTCAGVVTARVLAVHAAALAGVLTLAAVLLGGWSLVSSSRRYRRVSQQLVAGLPLPDGRLAALVAALSAVLGLSGLGLVTLR